MCTGKAELGQGIETALLQVAAEELDLPPARLRIITADTARAPNEGLTAGSRSITDSAPALQRAAAHLRQLLLEAAAARWQRPLAGLTTAAGAVHDGPRSLDYGELAAGVNLSQPVRADIALKDPARYGLIGTDLPRLDIPAKVLGGAAYVHDLRPDGLLHARVVRPPGPKARLQAVDTADVSARVGVMTVIRDGDFLAVVAEQEFQAVLAMRALAEAARWQVDDPLPDSTELEAFLRSNVSQVGEVAAQGERELPAGAAVNLRFSRPYQLHGALGPSAAVAQFDAETGQYTLWSHTQGAHPTRAAVAEMLQVPSERVRLIHVDGAGCYGHNGADDACADAALIARALPGRPVKLVWTREQEHAFEPFGPAMAMEVSAALDGAGRISHWHYHVWSNTHLARPGPAGALLAAQHLQRSIAPPEPKLQISPAGSGDRNAVPYYDIPNVQVRWHFVKATPLRTSALRALGAYANVFALESGMDALAHSAGRDPVALRLAHLTDVRARAVVERAATAFDWAARRQAPRPPGRGFGFAFARYKNMAAYLALAVEVEVEPGSGRVRLLHAEVAVDAGQPVNPNGIRNQIEGGVVQSISWTLFEAVSFNRTRPTSVDWSSYPVLRFESVPDEVNVHVMERPGEPYLGTGEAAQGLRRPPSPMPCSTPPASASPACRSPRSACAPRCGPMTLPRLQHLNSGQ